MGDAYVELQIRGMTCDGCAQTIRRGLGREPGVRTVSVDVKSGRARVQFDPEATDAGRIAAAPAFGARFIAEVVGVAEAEAE